MIAVFGAGGFVGRNLLHDLERLKLKFKAFARSPVHGFESKTFIHDFNDPATYIDQLRDVTDIILLVSNSVPGTNANCLIKEVQCNLIPYLRFLEGVKNFNFNKVIFLSSGGAVYGIPQYQRSISEDHPLNPISNYGCVKLMIEKSIQKISYSAAWEPVIFRAANPIGRYQPVGQQGLVAKAVNACLTKSTIEIWGDGSVVRDYFDVQDLTAAIIKCLSIPEMSGIYNVSSNQGFSVNHIISSVENVTGLSLRKKYIRSRAVDVPINILDNNKLKEKMSWEPQFLLHESIRHIISYQTL